MHKAPLHILMVDDDADDRQFFEEAINEIDPEIACYFAFDGIQALDILNTLQPLPDYLFLDLNMPRMGGKQCLKEIKKDPRLTNIPVIIYSTSKFVKEEAEVLKLGAYYFMQKPSNFDEIREFISDVITGEVD